MSKTRFESFSDGVFAFAITLLVLSIALDHRAASDRELLASIVRLAPNLLAYILSFAVIGIMWQNHHALFRMVAAVDRMTVLLNLLLLAGTVFIPFVTSLLGTYPFYRTSAVSYGVVLTYCSIAYNVLLHHLVRRQVLDAPPQATEATVHAYRVGLAVYAAATAVGFVAPALSFAAYFAITLYYLVPRGVDRDLAA